MSSLAAQLAQSASLNAALLVDRSKRKTAESYLFTGRDADQHDLDSIYALGTNAFLKLCSLDHRLKQFESQLFSDGARALDRTLSSKEDDERLNGVIEKFLGLLGPWLLEAPSARVLEWLVRRFRINEFNVQSLLAVFLPYHDTAQFTKLVTILHIKPSTTWSFLLPFKSAAQKLPRVSLVTEMLRNTDVARFVTSLLPSALREERSHRVLLAFNAATLHEFISRSKMLAEGTMAYVLPAVLEPLEKGNDAPRDAILGSFILLSALSQKCELSAPALKVILGSMATCSEVVATKQFISAMIAVCEPQTELETFSSSMVTALLRIPDIKEELQVAVSWVGSEKLIRPLVPALMSRLPEATVSTLLESIISTPLIPVFVVEHAASLLIEQALSLTALDKASASRSLLAIIQQRHPDVLQRVTRAAQDRDEEFKETINQLTISLSLASTTSSQDQDKADMILASTNADTNVRMIAIKEMLASLSQSAPLSDTDRQSITFALIARIQDPEHQILEAVYKKPALVAPLFVAEASTFIETLVTLVGAKPKRSSLRLHLDFVLGHLYRALGSKYKEEVVSKILFPFLLFSRPRQYTAETVWDLIVDHMAQETGKEFEILKGCGDIVKAERGRAGEDSIETMKSVNAALTVKIAQNILASNQLYELLPSLLSQIEARDSHTRALGYLITRSLLEKLSGGHQVDVAGKVLGAMKLEEISGIDDLATENNQFLQALKEVPEKNVILKPNKQSTLSWLQVSLIATICGIPPPESLAIDWLSEQSSSQANDSRGLHYVALMRTAYRLLNRVSSLPVLTSSLFHVFFINLKIDALAFLMGVCITPGEQEGDLLKEIALRHAAAFLEAHVLEDDGVDFQTIVPALLVALQNPSAPVRRAAVECISRVRLITERKLRSVYKFDVIYGDVKDTLQYLDQGDLRWYLSHLVSHEQHFVQDHMYLRVVHGECLQPTKDDRKKDAEHKDNILYYLLSHVNVLNPGSMKIKLLESLSLVSASAKAVTLLPSTGTLHELKTDETLTCLLLSCVDASSTAELNGNGGLWNAYMNMVKQYLQPDSAAAPREILIRLLETEIFTKLVYERQGCICKAIISIAAREPDAQSYCKKLLSNVIEDVPLIIELLNAFVPTPQSNTPRAAKRIKTTEPNQGENTMPELRLLAEVLGTKPLQGSLDLISALLETLSELTQSVHASQADANYAQQMLMSAVDNATSNVPEAPNITPSVIRLDVLVEVIRVAGNPQTFHQALLLIAGLARLAPESVLPNVMPVFTFMGSNVFHRDDTYSFRVVQKTIDGVVPVMASSLKKANDNPLDLYIASRDFLRVFTDAANHIPRYRRTNFFAHLVDVLGPDDFLSPVCMLLAEKLSNRVVRQSQAEAAATLALPIALLHRATPMIQIAALVEFLKESRRLVTRATEPADTSNGVSTLLDHVVDKESSLSTVTYMKRAQTLVNLIGQAVQPSVTVNSGESGKESLNCLVSDLTSLATLGDGTSGIKLGGLATAAQTTLGKVLNAMPASSFIETIASMLASGNPTAHIGALELFTERIPKISDRARQEAAVVMGKIVDSIVQLLSQDNITLQTHCLRALQSVALTMTPKEGGGLATALPSILAALDVPELAVHALDALIPLSTKLGPKLIPFFKNIVARSVNLLNCANDTFSEKTTAVLHGLLVSIPAFWGSDAITKMVNLYMDHCREMSSSPRAAMSSLMKAIAKKVPAKLLLPSLVDIWISASPTEDLDRIFAYSDFLFRTLRYSPRAVILEQTRSLSKVFLEAFDVVKALKYKESKVEAQVISAFREFVIKLNESTFRPIFRRFYDWAFVNEGADTARKVIFFHTYSSLLDYFKALMVPYTSFLLQTFVSHLKLLADSTDEESSTLWSSLVATLTKTLSYDDGGFWRDDKLRQIASAIIEQVPLCTKLPAEVDAKTLLQQCLDALLEDVSDDALLKSINLELLMHTRSENARIRQFTLVCSESLWSSHGGKLLGFVAETATFIAECGEDENDMVVKESFRLKGAVENVAGRIDGL